MAQYHDETPSLMEPMLISEDAPQRTVLVDLSLELAQCSLGLSKSLPDGIRIALDDLVRLMNCYYSNLIEGHETILLILSVLLKTTSAAIQKKETFSLRRKLMFQYSNG
jgi:Flp pilus assembly CpaE family ATPase